MKRIDSSAFTTKRIKNQENGYRRRHWIKFIKTNNSYGLDASPAWLKAVVNMESENPIPFVGK